MDPLPPILLSTDFDGTILDHSLPSPLAPEFFDWLEEIRTRRKVIWVINTGRDWDMLAIELKARHARVWPDWVVLIEREVHRIKDQQSDPLTSWNSRCLDIHADLFTRASGAIETTRKELQTFDNLLVIEDVGSPLGMIADSQEQADRVAATVQPLLKQFPDMRLVQNTIYFRFAHMDFHKGSALSIIATEEGIPVEHCFAAGDHLNDLPMLDSKYAAMLACPANAIDEVKQQVTKHHGFVATKTAAAGILQALHHFFD